MSERDRYPVHANLASFRGGFPFFNHRTMAQVMRDEAVQARKEADHAIDTDRPVRLNDPANDPFAKCQTGVDR